MRNNADSTLIVEMWKGVGVPNIGRITVSYFLSKRVHNKTNIQIEYEYRYVLRKIKLSIN